MFFVLARVCRPFCIFDVACSWRATNLATHLSTNLTTNPPPTYPAISNKNLATHLPQLSHPSPPTEPFISHQLSHPSPKI